MKHFGDITKINGSEVPLVDIITGGSPCQDLSVAGKRAGLKHSDKGDDETTRSGLFMEQIRIVKELRNECIRQLRVRGANVDFRLLKPRFMVWENVPGAFSSNKGEDFRCVLEEICRVADQTATVPMPEKGKWSTSGCIMGDGWSVAWRVHDAQFWGVPQRRKRIELVADFGGTSAPEILFERESVSGDSEQSREERKDIASDTEGSIGTAISDVGSPACNQGGMAVVYDASRRHDYQPFDDDICETVQAHYGTGGEGDPNTLMVLEKKEEPILLESNQNHATVQTDGISTTLPASMGMGGGYVPMVTDSMEVAGTLDASYYKGCGERNDVEMEVVVQSQAWDGSQVSPTLTANNANGAQRMPDKENFNAVITYGLDRASFNQGKNAKYDFQIDEEKIGTQVAKGPGAVFQSVVRRLTPTECERLQGYPDGWTDIGDWTDSKGKKHKGDADSPRYKALGNSIALPFWQWMADRMVNKLKEDGVDNPAMASLFDGIGGFPLVYSRAGCKPVWASEIEEFPMAVTKKHFGED